MKKTKFITLLLLVTVMLLGIGYAWWSETITITSEVGTGELNVEFLEPSNAVSFILDNGFPRFYSDSIVSFNRSIDRHTLTASFRDVFPGVFYSIPFTMKNTGTIPAVFRDCTVSYDITDSTLNGEEKNYLLEQLSANLEITSLYVTKYNSLTHKPIGKQMEIVNPAPVTLGQLASTITNALADKIRLEPGEYLQLESSELKSGEYDGIDGGVMFLFSGGFDNSFEQKQFTVNINMNWKQFNEN